MRGPLVALVALVGLLGACTSVAVPADPAAGAAGRFARAYGLEALDRTVVRIDTGAGTLRLEALVADTDAARSRGLQGVDALPDGVGMLFVFPDPPGSGGRSGFWMLDTLVPLDIAFVDAGTIVGVATMVPCVERPCPITHPGTGYDMALETAAGGLVDAGVAVGDRLVLEPDGSGGP
jgi:uncharacterized membrane protein (UPF0127 family)